MKTNKKFRNIVLMAVAVLLIFLAVCMYYRSNVSDKEPLTEILAQNVWALILIAVIIAGAAALFILSEERKKQEIAANAAKTAFLLNMSHDIRTPMNAILGFTDIALRHEDEPEKVQDSLNKIKISGVQLLNLVNDIMEMSRIESGSLELAENPANIRSGIEEVRQMGNALAIPKNIEFRTVIGEIKNPYVLTDELHINEVLINLISNAIKYTGEGGEVDFRSEQIGEAKDGVAKFRFTIADNGIGMSEEFQQHLFESFAREETATISKAEGTGLGLSIVKKIVDIAGGNISVKSERGKGSTFTVDIPMKVMDEAREKAFREETEKKLIRKMDSAFEGKRVLLVEDNDMNREIAAEILKEAGFVIESAGNGEIAVNMARENGPEYYDFILMDIQMPVMDGYGATAEIRKLPGGSGVPIIALSANAFAEDKQKSLDAGMDDHIAKPIDVTALLSAMQALARQ